jgi:alkylated DNA repair dioxygenase AlkB
MEAPRRWQRPCWKKQMHAPAIHLNLSFLREPARLFAHLQETVVWDERMKARKTASFGVAYNYSQMFYPEVPMPESLAPVCAALGEELGFVPNNCLLNYYPDGAASMGFHSDTATGLAEGTGVAIVSLGAERSIVYRSKRDKTVRFSYPLPSGSLLFMSNQLQEEWLHAIPKQDGVGERISLTFRRVASA